MPTNPYIPANSVKNKIQRIRIKDQVYDIVVQKDWNQNDARAVSYVDNRTHFYKASCTPVSTNFSSSIHTIASSAVEDLNLIPANWTYSIDTATGINTIYKSTNQQPDTLVEGPYYVLVETEARTQDGNNFQVADILAFPWPAFEPAPEYKTIQESAQIIPELPSHTEEHHSTLKNELIYSTYSASKQAPVNCIIQLYYDETQGPKARYNGEFVQNLKFTIITDANIKQLPDYFVRDVIDELNTNINQTAEWLDKKYTHILTWKNPQLINAQADFWAAPEDEETPDETPEVPEPEPEPDEGQSPSAYSTPVVEDEITEEPKAEGYPVDFYLVTGSDNLDARAKLSNGTVTLTTHETAAPDTLAVENIYLEDTFIRKLAEATDTCEALENKYYSETGNTFDSNIWTTILNDSIESLTEEAKSQLKELLKYLEDVDFKDEGRQYIKADDKEFLIGESLDNLTIHNSLRFKNCSFVVDPTGSEAQDHLYGGKSLEAVALGSGSVAAHRAFAAGENAAALADYSIALGYHTIVKPGAHASAAIGLGAGGDITEGFNPNGYCLASGVGDIALGRGTTLVKAHSEKIPETAGNTYYTLNLAVNDALIEGGVRGAALNTSKIQGIGSNNAALNTGILNANGDANAVFNNAQISGGDNEGATNKSTGNAAFNSAKIGQTTTGNAVDTNEITNNFAANNALITKSIDSAAFNEAQITCVGTKNFATGAARITNASTSAAFNTGKLCGGSVTSFVANEGHIKAGTSNTAFGAGIIENTTADPSADSKYNFVSGEGRISVPGTHNFVVGSGQITEEAADGDTPKYPSYCTVGGQECIAKDSHAAVFGFKNEAYEFATALGWYSRALGDASIAQGRAAVATGGVDVALGAGRTLVERENKSYTYNVAIGNGAIIASTADDLDSSREWVPSSDSNTLPENDPNVPDNNYFENVALGNGQIAASTRSFAGNNATVIGNNLSAAFGNALISSEDREFTKYEELEDTVTNCYNIALGEAIISKGKRNFAANNAQLINDTDVSFGVNKARINDGYNSFGAHDAHLTHDIGSAGFNDSVIEYARSGFATGSSKVIGSESDRVWYATAMGEQSQATASAATAIGYEAKACGKGSVALGSGIVNSTDTITVTDGQGTHIYSGNIAVGYKATIESGVNNFVANSAQIAGSSHSAAFGGGQLTNGEYNFALGGTDGTYKPTVSGGSGNIALNKATITNSIDSLAAGTSIIENCTEGFALGGGNHINHANYGVALGYHCILTEGADAAFAAGLGAEAHDVGDIALGGGKTTGYNQSPYVAYNVAIGDANTIVSGGSSNMALAGGIVSSSGDHNLAAGYGAKIYSGRNNIALNNGQISEQSSSTDNIQHAFATGSGRVLALSDDNHKLQYQKLWTPQEVIVKGTKQSFNYGTALGEGTRAMSLAATAMGFYSTAIGDASIAAGVGANAFGGGDVALGGGQTINIGTLNDTETDRSYTFNAALNQGSVQGSSTFSFAAGTSIIKNAAHAAAFGANTSVTKNYGFAAGDHTKAISEDAATAFGCYNTGEYFFEIGNGSASTPSNALAITREGNIYVAGKITAAHPDQDPTKHNKNEVVTIKYFEENSSLVKWDSIADNVIIGTEINNKNLTVNGDVTITGDLSFAGDFEFNNLVVNNQITCPNIGAADAADTDTINILGVTFTKKQLQILADLIVNNLTKPY